MRSLCLFIDKNGCVGTSDRREDVYKNHDQQVENCGHDAHNAEHVFQVHWTLARFTDAHTHLQKTDRTQQQLQNLKGNFYAI